MTRRWLLVALALVWPVLGLAAQVRLRLLPAASIPSNACGMQLNTSAPVFCDTFDSAFEIIPGKRSGQLDPTIWGISRTSGDTTLDSRNNAWVPVDLVGCSGTLTDVLPPNDVIICNGQVRESLMDNPTGMEDAGFVYVLAMYPRQPFDWAGRTGTVSFDVSNNTKGSHAAWPEFWITDKPVPAPFTHLNSWRAWGQHSIGIMLVDQHSGFCGGGSPAYQGVGAANVVNNWVPNDSRNGGDISIESFECIRASTALTEMNHYEITVSVTEINVYGTDAGTTTPLKHISRISGFGTMGFTRGLIWIEDAHYNADKAEPVGTCCANSQRQNTFVWDNVAFDGPFTYRDLSYDAPDNTTILGDGTQALGKYSAGGSTTSWTIEGIPAAVTVNGGVRVLFNFATITQPSDILLSVNGHAHNTPWPYPDNELSGWRTHAISIPLSDLNLGGTQTVLLGSDDDVVISNVNIVLVDATAP